MKWRSVTVGEKDRLDLAKDNEDRTLTAREEKNEKIKSERRKQVREEYKKIGVTIVGVLVIVALVFAGKALISRKKTVQTVATVETTTQPETTTQVEETTTQKVVDPTKPMVALTFDDGPGEDTGRLLEVLEQYGAKATFFLCGTSLRRSSLPIEDYLKKMDELGCDIGNHTMNHKSLDDLSKKKIRSEINGVDKIVKSITGHKTAFLRPPYGAGIRDSKVKKNVKTPMICWSVDTEDWKKKDKKKAVSKSIVNNAKDGEIILLHDIHSWSVDAAIDAIPKLIEKGYQLVTVSEMAKAKGIELQDGEVYFSFN